MLVLLAGEYEDFWCFDPVKEVWADLSSKVVRAPMEKAPGTLMANAGGRLYVVRAGLLPSVKDARLSYVDPAAPLWVSKQEVVGELTGRSTGLKKRSWMDGASGLFLDGPPNNNGNVCAEAGGKLFCVGGSGDSEDALSLGEDALSLCLFISFSLSLSLSLSLHIHVYVYIYIYIYITLSLSFFLSFSPEGLVARESDDNGALSPSETAPPPRASTIDRSEGDRACTDPEAARDPGRDLGRVEAEVGRDSGRT